MENIVYEGDSKISGEQKRKLVNWFLEHHPIARPRDVYGWLREGEYGKPVSIHNFSLDRLTQDIRLARIEGIRDQPVWEPLGLAMLLVRINLVPYSDSGCPLKRLLMLEEKVQNIRPNPMRFKSDWSFFKAGLSENHPLTENDLIEFENSIPFHLVPEMEYGEKFLAAYGLGYRIVLRHQFFHFFPEYGMEEEALISSH